MLTSRIISILTKQGDERDYPIRGITIVGDGDIVGYWEEETNNEQV